MPSLLKELPVMTPLIFTRIYKIKTGTTPTFQMRKPRQRSNLPKVVHPGTHLGVKLAPHFISHKLEGGGVWGQESQIQRMLGRERLVCCLSSNPWSSDSGASGSHLVPLLHPVQLFCAS